MAKGHVITQLEPKVWFNPNSPSATTPGIIPKIGLPYGFDFSTIPSGGWIQVPYTANGLQWTFVNPKQDVPTDEIGILDTLAAGTQTVNVTFQAKTPFMDLIQRIASLRKTTKSTRAQVESLTFATGCSTNGNLGVTLSDGTTQTIAVTSASQGTASLVATAVAAGSFTGWTTAASGATVTFTKSTPGATTGLLPSITPNATGVTLVALTGAQVVTAGYGAVDQYNLDAKADNSFMLLADGHFRDNSLKDTAGQARIIAYNVEQTDNPQVHFRTLGNDSLLQPTLTARCLTSVLAAAQVTGTGHAVSDYDPDGRLDWYVM